MFVKRGVNPQRLALLSGSTLGSTSYQCHLNSTFRRQLWQHHVDQRTLQPCSLDNFFQPVFERYSGIYNRKPFKAFAYDTYQNIEQEHDPWQEEVAPRLAAAGLFVDKKELLFDQWVDGRMLYPNAEAWSSAVFLRHSCKRSFLKQTGDLEEINARRLCAELKDPSYPTVFHSLETQAHILYICGRAEVERESKIWQPLGYYILCVAAGLGQLDAALLLHQLEKHNPTFVVQPLQREIITRAAESKVDWRAMVAHCEHIISKTESRSGSKRLQPGELEQCIDLLVDATNIRHGVTIEKLTRPIPPDGCLDADALMEFRQPYELLFKVASEEIILGNTSERVLEVFKAAARLGVYDHEDATVAGSYAEHLFETEGEYTEEWIHCARTAGLGGDAKACFQLGKYHFEKDGWVPSLAARVLEDRTGKLRQQQALIGNMDIEELMEEPSFIDDVDREIRSKRDERLFQLREGVSWMRSAAELPIDNAVQMLNRHVIVAGLFRLNGFPDEGRKILLEARAQLQDCIDEPSTKVRALQTLDEYLEVWDQRKVHQLLHPNLIDQLLDR